MRILTTAVALLLLAATAWAQPARDEIKKHPGYFDFGKVDGFSNGDELVEIDLTQPLLSFVGKFAEGEDPELGELLSHLLLVNVRVFSYDEDKDTKLRDHIDKLVDRLQDQKWQNIVRVRGDESANIFVKIEGADGNPEDMILSGLAVLAIEDEEAVFVNVVGNFGLEQISRVGRHFDIPHMQGFDHNGKKDRRGSDQDESDDNGGY